MPSRPISRALNGFAPDADHQKVTVISLPSFAQAKATRCFRIAALSGAIAVGVALLAPLAQAFVFFVYVVALTLAGGAISVLQAGFRARQGAMGEDRVVRALESLDDRHLLIRNWVPPGGKGDLDLLLLGSFGALVLEVKSYATPVAFRQGKWRIKDSKGRWRVTKNFSAQLARNVREAQRALGVPTDGLIVFNDRATLTFDTSMPSVVRRKELLAKVLALPDRGVEARRLHERFSSVAPAA